MYSSPFSLIEASHPVETAAGGVKNPKLGSTCPSAAERRPENSSTKLSSRLELLNLLMKLITAWLVVLVFPCWLIIWL
jgi:hypothetical protein